MLEYIPVRVSIRDRGATVLREPLSKPVDIVTASEIVCKDKKFIFDCELNSGENRSTRAAWKWDLDKV